MKNIFQKKNSQHSQVKNVKDFFTRIAMDDQPDHWAIQIVQGPYTGLVYKYGVVNIDKQKKLLGIGRNTIKYEYDILYVPEHLVGKALPEEDEIQFHNFLGDILVSMLHEHYSSSGDDDRKEQLNDLSSIEVKNSDANE